MTRDVTATAGTLSVGQIAGYAAKAGFTGKDLSIAVAVALAESGGNPRAHNGKAPDDSYGLWQINMLGSMGPERRKRFGIASNDELYDPTVNAKAAYSIWRQSGWGAWTTYTSGKYKEPLKEIESGAKRQAFLDGLKASGGFAGALGSALQGGEDVSGSLPSLPNPVEKVASSIDAFSKTVFNGIASIVAMGVASALLIIGLVILMRNTKPVKAVRGVVTTAATRRVKRVVK